MIVSVRAGDFFRSVPKVGKRTISASGCSWRYSAFQMAEVAVLRNLFADLLRMMTKGQSARVSAELSHILAAAGKR